MPARDNQVIWPTYGTGLESNQEGGSAISLPVFGGRREGVLSPQR